MRKDIEESYALCKEHLSNPAFAGYVTASTQLGQCVGVLIALGMTRDELVKIIDELVAVSKAVPELFKERS